MTKRGAEERTALNPNTVTISEATPVDGRVGQTPPFERQPEKKKRSRKPPARGKMTVVVVHESIKIGAHAILKDWRERFGLEGPDDDYLETNPDGTITVHHNSLWKKRRARVKRPPRVAE